MALTLKELKELQRKMDMSCIVFLENQLNITYHKRRLQDYRNKAVYLTEEFAQNRAHYLREKWEYRDNKTKGAK